MSLRPCDSREDAGALLCSRVGRPKPGQPTRELAQPVPYIGGVPGDHGLNKRAACGVLSFFAWLGSLHGAFICAYLEINNLT